MRRTVRAKRDRVFDAWTDPDQLKRWWGPGEFTTPVAEVDARPGGTYLLVMQPPAGDPMRLVGSFQEVLRPERLVYTWRWDAPWSDGHESLVTVEFLDRGNETEVVVRHEHFGPEGEDPYRTGWEGGLHKLEALVTAKEGIDG
jgi:uncharacterized protein YndB with AHSA1/START domain